MNKKLPPVVYLSLEIALESQLRTYAGGLGVLAGDILKSAANIKFPMVGLSLFNRHGYLRQTIDSDGQQIISDDLSRRSRSLKKLPATTVVKIGSHDITVGVWQANICGPDNFLVPVYFLDTDREAINRDGIWRGHLSFMLLVVFYMLLLRRKSER